MIPAFWDSSALVPLCLEQQPSAAVQRLAKQYSIVVWWGTSVEINGAFERLSRIGNLTPADKALARDALDELRNSWLEIRPSEKLRYRAELLLLNHPLKSADAVQLAAAWVWSAGVPESCTFISADTQLLRAARKVGFQTVPT